MANTSSPFTRDEWNNIIDAVNDLGQNPPNTDLCEMPGLIPHVGPDHKWSVGDIETVRNALMQICPDNAFGSIGPLWKGKILDEINSAIGNGWCGCDEDFECVECPYPKLSSFNPGTPDFMFATTDDANPQGCTSGWCNYAAKLNGLQLGPPGYLGVIVSPWRFSRDDGGPWSKMALGNVFSCDDKGICRVPAADLLIPPPIPCNAISNRAWVGVSHSTTYWYTEIQIAVFLQCSTLCTPKGKPIGTPSLQKTTPTKK
jgi:hypothetical protein